MVALGRGAPPYFAKPPCPCYHPPMTTPTRRTPEETGRLGDRIYQSHIRPLVEADHHGQFVAIDVDSGSYAIADTALAASDSLRERHPDADTWCLRVGYGVLRHFGGRSLRNPE